MTTCVVLDLKWCRSRVVAAPFKGLKEDTTKPQGSEGPLGAPILVGEGASTRERYPRVDLVRAPHFPRLGVALQ